MLASGVTHLDRMVSGTRPKSDLGDCLVKSK